MKNDNYRQFKKNNKRHEGGENSQVEIVSDKMEHEAIQAQPLEVRVYNGNFDKALRAFRALVQKERILSIYKEKSGYEKPSDKKRRKRNEMRRKLLELSTSHDRKNRSKHRRKNKNEQQG